MAAPMAWCPSITGPGFAHSILQLNSLEFNWLVNVNLLHNR